MTSVCFGSPLNTPTAHSEKQQTAQETAKLSVSTDFAKNPALRQNFEVSRVKQSGRVEIEKGTNVTEEARMRILNLKIPSNN